MINSFDFEDQTTDFENQFNCSCYKKKKNNPPPLQFANKEMKTDTMLKLLMETKEVINVIVLRLMMDI